MTAATRYDEREAGVSIGLGGICMAEEEGPLGRDAAGLHDARLDASTELLRRARAGDRRALDGLFARYLPMLRRFATGRLPAYARDTLDTDDLVQEVALRAMNRLEAFEPNHPGALMAYLRQAVVNRIRDELRRAGRRPARVADPGSGQPSDRPSPIEEAIGSEAEERYENALRCLKSEDREAIVARIEMQLSYDEVADALGKPSVEAARMQVARALLRLAKEMGAT
jgi:RNA polymerase sigma factor (sigma-70 family)